MHRLICELEAVKDPRTGNAKKHKLGDILFIAIAAGIADIDTWTQMEDYALEHEAFFRQYLELPAGIPSHDTFNRVFAIMDPVILEKNYQYWIEQFVKIKEGAIISIDGKTIRGAGSKEEEGYAHMVSACLSDEGISLGQLNVDKKTNEITVIPQLLDMLDIKGCIITADAMGCQKEIVKKIVNEKKSSYVLAVKDNQKNLHEQILETAKMVRPSSVYTETDAGHGRVEERVYRIYRDLSFVAGVWNWEKLSALVVVESKRYDKKKQKESVERRCYITSLPKGSSAKIAHAIRNHWQVESMHWIMDVVFGEDASRKRVYNAAENYSRLMKVVLAILRHYKKNTGGTKSLARMRKQAAWNTAVLEEILFTAFATEEAKAESQQ